MQKFFTNQTKTITGAAVILGLASLGSRITAIIRDRIFAHQFGAGNTLDVYYAAFRIPDFVFNLLIIGALSAGFIPILTKLLHQDKGEAWRVTSSILNILGIALLGLCGILFLLTPQLTAILVPGFDSAKQAQITMLTRIMFLSPIILGLSSVVGGVLQSCKAFFIYALTPIMYNVGIIFGAVVFVPLFGITGLAYGVVLGALLHFFIQLPALWHCGFQYRLIFDWKNRHVREMGRLMIPRAMGLAADQLNFFVTVILASTLGAGSLAIFQLANNLQNVPISLIGISFAQAAFPTMAAYLAEKNTPAMAVSFTNTLKHILFFIFPITVVIILLRFHIVRVLLGSGQFDWHATTLTANTLAFFSVSLFAQCLTHLLARTFYALENTWIPFAITLVTTVIDIGVSILLKQSLGIVGLAIGFSIAEVIQVILLWIMLRRQIPLFKEADILRMLAKMCFALITMGITMEGTIFLLDHIVDTTTFFGVLAQGAVAGILGLLTYAVLCFGLQVKEMIELKMIFTQRFFKSAVVPAEIVNIQER